MAISSTTSYKKYADLQVLGNTATDPAEEGAVWLSGSAGNAVLRVNAATLSGSALQLGNNANPISSILDQDNMSGNSATALATQQSIKAYVDAQVTAQDLDATTDSGTIDIDLDSETLTVAGGTGLDTAGSGTTITVNITAGGVDTTQLADDAVTGAKIALFDDSLAATTTHFLIADGTDYSSFALSGDVTCTNAGVVTIAAASVENSMLADDAVDSDELAAGAVDLAHMSANSVDSDQYVDGSIDLVHMSANSVDSDQYVDGSVDNVHLANSATTIGSTSVSLGATSTTLAGLTGLDFTAANASVAASLGANTLTLGGGGSTVACANDLTVAGTLVLTGDLTVNGTTATVNSTVVAIDDKVMVFASGSGNAAIASAGGSGWAVGGDEGSAKLASFLYDGVDSFDVSDHLNLASGQELKINNVSTLSATTLGSAVVNSSLTTVGTIATGVWQGTTIKTAYIQDANITLAKMAANSVDSDQYVDASIDTAHIGNDQITNALMADDAINSDQLAAGAVDLAHMSANSVDSDQYVDGSIDLVHMSANSVDSDQYVDGSIDAAHLADDAVTGAKIALFDDSLAATTTHFLIADGTDYSSFALSGDATCTNAGAVSLAATNTNLTTLANVTTVGALNAGTVTSGFGNFDNGSSTLDTGVLTAASMVCTAGSTFGGGYGADGATIDTDGNLATKGTITTADTLTGLAGASFGSSNECSISSAGAITAAGALTIGASGAPADAIFWGTNADDKVTWDASANMFILADGGTRYLSMGGESGNYAIDVGNGSAANSGNRGSIRAASFVTYSDKELKRDIAPMKDALSKVMKLDAVSYKMKNDDRQEIGFIAQDVAKVVPEVCAIDADGVGRGIDYSRMSSLLVGALKAQQEQIAQLKEIVSKLQKQFCFNFG